MVQSLLILNGPGLDRLGEIARDQYGAVTLADVRKLSEATGAALGYDIDFRQSNDTGEVVKDSFHGEVDVRYFREVETDER